MRNHVATMRTRRWIALAAALGGAVATGAVALPSARSAPAAPCVLPGAKPLWIDYGQGGVPAPVRAVFSRPGVIVAASGIPLPRAYRSKGASVVHFELKLPRLVGQPSAPADPATIQAKADDLYRRATVTTQCTTPTVALNELAGAGIATPWSATNTTYRANVLALVRRLAERGARPVLLIPGKLYVQGDAAAWWRNVASVADLVYESYYNADGIDRLGRIVGPRRVRLGQRSVIRTFTRAGIPVSRLGFMLGFHAEPGTLGRENLQPREKWFRVVKWQTNAARQVAVDSGTSSIWTWGWAVFGPKGVDPDKADAACVYLWTRDPALCDGPAVAGPGFNRSRVEGTILIPTGVTCISAAGKLRESGIAALAKHLKSRPAALTGLFARHALRKAFPVAGGEIAAFEREVIARSFGGAREAYLAELTRLGASLAIAQGAIADELRRRRMADQIAQGAAPAGRTVLTWTGDLTAAEADTATCRRDDLPGSGDFPASNRREIASAPLLQRLPFLVGDTIAPATPAGLVVTRTGAAVTLDWADSAEPDTIGYLVHRATTPGGPYTQLTPLWLPQSTFVDRAPPAGTTPLYLVRAVDASGNTSEPTPETPPAAPPPPA
jgi:hypothetical protein